MEVEQLPSTSGAADAHGMRRDTLPCPHDTHQSITTHHRSVTLVLALQHATSSSRARPPTTSRRDAGESMTSRHKGQGGENSCSSTSRAHSSHVETSIPSFPALPSRMQPWHPHHTYGHSHSVIQNGQVIQTDTHSSLESMAATHPPNHSFVGRSSLSLQRSTPAGRLASYRLSFW